MILSGTENIRDVIAFPKTTSGSCLMSDAPDEVDESQLKDLGIDAIYLTPIFLANSSHRYDSVDYMVIDPLLGSKEEFKSLVQKLHENGIKIILDLVFNHTSTQFFAFKDILQKQDKSKYKDWYFIDNFLWK